MPRLLLPRRGRGQWKGERGEGGRVGDRQDWGKEGDRWKGGREAKDQEHRPVLDQAAEMRERGAQEGGLSREAEEGEVTRGRRRGEEGSLPLHAPLLSPSPPSSSTHEDERQDYGDAGSQLRLNVIACP